jgi:hypothetical protein
MLYDSGKARGTKDDTVIIAGGLSEEEAFKTAIATWPEGTPPLQST